MVNPDLGSTDSYQDLVNRNKALRERQEYDQAYRVAMEGIGKGSIYLTGDQFARLDQSMPSIGITTKKIGSVEQLADIFANNQREPRTVYFIVEGQTKMVQW